MWTALFSVTFFAVVIAIGDFISAKTKGIVATVLVAMILYIIGFNTGFIPASCLGDTGLLTITSTFGMLITVTNLGTMVDIRNFLKEWRIVVISIASLGVMGTVFLSLGSVIFDMTHALVAYPPVAGGFTAVVMMTDHANAIGKPELGSFAWFLVTLQMFVGIPLASYFLRQYCSRFVKSNEFTDCSSREKDNTKRAFCIFRPIPEKYNSPNVILAKLLVVTCFSSYLGTVTPIPAAIYCLLLGMMGCELGLLERQSLQKSGMINLIMFCMMASAPNSFSTLSIPTLLSMAAPVVFFLLAGGISLSVGGLLVGKLLKVPASLSIPLALNAMFGFPFNIMITDDVIRTMGLNEEDSIRLKSIVQPQMTIAGFASMTIMSVIIAAIVIPYIN